MLFLCSSHGTGYFSPLVPTICEIGISRLKKKVVTVSHILVIYKLVGKFNIGFKNDRVKKCT